MRISEAFDVYCLDCIALKGQSAKTEESHYTCLRVLMAYTGDIELELLTFQMVRDWKLHLDKDRAPVSVRTYIVKLRVVLAYFHKRGYDCLDPDLIPIPKRQGKLPEFVSPEEVRRMISSTRKIKNKAIISLLYASGLRIGELCALNRDAIKDDSFSVIGKGGKPRLCFIDQRTKTLLELYLDTREDNNPALFLTEAGKRITAGTIQETFKSIRKISGIQNVHPHTLRHSFATNLLKRNCNMRYVQVLLGHQSLQTTQIYTHVVDYDLKEVYAKYHTI